MESVLLVIAVVGALLGALSLKAGASVTLPPRSFPDGGKFWARYCADFAASGAAGRLNREMTYIVAEIETDFGRSDALAKTNSYFNRHVGLGRGEWTGHAYTTRPPAGRQPEVLRIFSDRPQSIRDVAQLLEDDFYSNAHNAMERGDADGFFVGIASGNGKEGWVGAYPSAKAADYLAGLRKRYARSFA